MSIAVTDPSLPASVGVSTNTDSTAGEITLSDGSSFPLVFGCGSTTGVSNVGQAFNQAAYTRREVRPGTSGLFGQCVQLTGANAQMRGAVIAELQVELETAGGVGALTECVLVQAQFFRFLATVEDVEEVPC